MRYLKLIMIIGMMVMATVSEDEKMDKICILGLTAFALSSIMGEEQYEESGTLEVVESNHD